MDLVRVFRTVMRHPFIVAATLIVALAIAAGLISMQKPEYEARASIVLYRAPGKLDEKGQPVLDNPLTDAGAVQLTTQLLFGATGTPQFADPLKQVGVTSTYEVKTDPAGSGAILNVRTVNKDPGLAVKDLGLVITQMGQELEGIQEGPVTDQNAYITLKTVTASAEATRLSGSKARIGLMVMALGALAAYGLALLAENRKSRSTAAAGVGAEAALDDGERHIGPAEVPPAPDGPAAPTPDVAETAGPDESPSQPLWVRPPNGTPRPVHAEPHDADPAPDEEQSNRGRRWRRNSA